MNLLPKTEVDFAKAEYWNKFFKERGSKEFEWYGEYNELCEELCKYLKKQDLILVVGCGNSLLSLDLFDIGYKNITNIDISSVVIKQMKNKVGKGRPEMVYEHMDVLQMTYDKDKFTVVLDKGTLDALMPDDTDDDRIRAKKLFSEVDRVLKENGRYIIISLLQSHILKQILDFFTDRGWMIRIARMWDVEKKKIKENGQLTMPVFMVVCIKFKKLIAPSILEVNVFVDKKPQRLSSKNEVAAIIHNIQNTTLNFREAKGEIEIKFCKKDEDIPRYSIFIVDAFKDQRKLLKYGAFIVPHGRETEWMFCTSDGRKCLLESSGFDRLAVILFHRQQEYGTMEDVQNELRQTILQLSPCFISLNSESPSIPYLSLGDGIGKRKTVFAGTSTYSGELIVEDVEIDGETFRRLIFMNNQAVVQSEVKMKQVTQKNKKNKKYVVDHTHIASHHILYMSIPVEIVSLESKSPSVAVIGVGGGSLCLLLHKLFPDSNVTGIEIDPLIVDIATNYFGLETNDCLKICVKDGLKFLEEKQKFDIIMFDVDNKERGSALSCPPSQFVESFVLKAVAESLGEKGIFIVNVVSRVNSEHVKLIKKIEEHFNLITWYNLKEDVNRIIFASNMTGKTKIEWQNDIKNAAISFEERLKNKLGSINTSFELDHLMDTLTL